MANSTTFVYNVPNGFLWCSVGFKFIAMIIGILGNVTVLMYNFFSSKEKTVASYLIGHLALAGLLVCLTFYPICIIEFLRTVSGIDSDQEFFCKLSRSTMCALSFASCASILAITVDRYLYFIKPLKYPMIVTCRRVLVAVLGIWLTSCCFFIVLYVHIHSSGIEFRSFCHIGDVIHHFKQFFVGYIPLTLTISFNFQIFRVARKQRKRILAETAIITADDPNKESAKKLRAVRQFFVALKTAKTFAIVVAVLTFCILTPTVVAIVLRNCSCKTYEMIWYVFFYYELFGINSIVNVFIYGMRHMKYREAYADILFKLLYCRRSNN